MKFIVLDIDQSILQKIAYYHSTDGIGCLTIYENEAMIIDKSMIKELVEKVPNERFAFIPVK